MKTSPLIILILAVFLVSPAAFAAKTGKITGGMAHEYPSWFKDSFLDLKEDASEAAEDNKHTILFLSLNGCPYCARMLRESFAENKNLILKDFDTIGLNIKGDRMVMMDGKTEISEKDMARKLRVRFTPTIIFLDENAKTVFRINGYWDPAQFRHALAYVRTKSYKKMPILAFIKTQKEKKVWNFAAHEELKDIKDFAAVKRPLLILFEDEGCSACGELHSEILNLPGVIDVLKTFDFVRLDLRSNAVITDINGNKTTPAKWAETLGVRSSPTFIAFDEGKERQRVDGKLYSHHFISLLAYVSGKHYKTYESWLKYNSQRTKEILASGRDVNMSDSDLRGAR